MIDFGKTGLQGKSFWTVDPIDGTKGFLRGEHYAICVGYVENGVGLFGAVACPFSGFIQYAVRGCGAFESALDPRKPLSFRRLHTSDSQDLVVVQSFERAHGSSDLISEILERSGEKAALLAIDSQAKYAFVANGTASCYLRVPKLSRKEKIWDHAAGIVIVKEAGGGVCDFSNSELALDSEDLEISGGIVCAANRGISHKILAAIHSLPLK